MSYRLSKYSQIIHEKWLHIPICQLFAVLLLSIIWAAHSVTSAASAFCGGMIAILSNGVMAFWLFNPSQRRKKAKQRLLTFYMAESVKLVMSVAGLVAAVCVLKCPVLAVCSGFFAAQMVLWFVPLWSIRHVVVSQ